VRVREQEVAHDGTLNRECRGANFLRGTLSVLAASLTRRCAVRAEPYLGSVELQADISAGVRHLDLPHFGEGRGGT
jgi:hypothetical protein